MKLKTCLLVILSLCGSILAGQTVESQTSRRENSSVSEYFRAANENVRALECGVEIHARDVEKSTKRAVRNRDGNSCVICGSNIKVEVDHRRALMNGGTNDIANLALLCDTHHTEKTKYDNSLRRKRERACARK